MDSFATFSQLNRFSVVSPSKSSSKHSSDILSSRSSGIASNASYNRSWTVDESQILLEALLQMPSPISRNHVMKSQLRNSDETAGTRSFLGRIKKRMGGLKVRG
ncbi:hypothetical protein G9A89_010467 [Geosiphon pyriformis]|nr:hypothetical protein G9A89_010467 [Geosiphon pyriformis]